MENILYALKLQHELIQKMRVAIQQIEKEPKEATEYFEITEQAYQDAIFECGKLSK